MPLLTEYLRRRRYAMIEPFLRGAVLDIGCGNAVKDLRLGTVERYVGLDYHPRLIAHLRRRFPQHEFYLCNLERDALPLEGTQFDTVLMVALIEHLENPGRLLAQVTNYMRPDGRLVVTTPTPRGERIHQVGARLGLFHPHAAQEHKYAYDRRSLEALFTAHGLSVMRYHPFELGGNQLVVCRLSDASAAPK